MKKFSILILGLILAVSLTSCKTLTGTKVPDLDVPFTANIDVESEGLEFNADIKRLGNALWEMEITSLPLQGMKITYTDEGITSVYNGFETITPIEEILPGNVFMQIFSAFDTAAATENPVLKERDGDIVFYGEIPASSFEILIDKESTALEELIFPESGIEIEINNIITKI
ncbi:MAG: hypothetical protein LBM87_07090 [Ruminococcus sp.]|jgi:hypothetical protein|nr:hypothetical protein [Ruminococcus sp.]